MSYDARSECFIEFCPPLINGVSSVNRLKTNSFHLLKQWFEDLERPTLVNIHVIEPLLNTNPSIAHSRPYTVSAHGTNNKHTGIDILQKSNYTYNECRQRDIILIEFSTNCDPRYLKAKQLSLDFFTYAPNIDLLSNNDRLLNINLPSHWIFFFMRTVQRYLCMQDGVHLVTKIRNRLLSGTANMTVSDHRVDVRH